MSDTIQVDLPKGRTIEDIKKEYGDLLVQAGNLQYQILISKENLDSINSKLRELNVEASKILPKEESK